MTVTDAAAFKTARMCETFDAPPAGTSKITVVIPGATEPLEDVPIAP